MHNVITEDSPEFASIQRQVQANRPRADFRSICQAVQAGHGHVKFPYSHQQVSNIVVAMKRQGLRKNVDYSITRVKTPVEKEGKTIEIEEIVLTPII